MLLCTVPATHGKEFETLVHVPSDVRQQDRILAALGVNHRRLPRVEERTLRRYYEYLSENLVLPFAACYPPPTTAEEEHEFQCTVIELLDPAMHLGDHFDGIFCKTRKGRYELNLPLLELGLPEDNPNFQLIEDYWYWFWNWR